MQDFQAGLMLVEKTKPQKSYKYPIWKVKMCNEKQEMEKKVKSLYTGVCKKPLNHRHVTAILTPPMG